MSLVRRHCSRLASSALPFRWTGVLTWCGVRAVAVLCVLVLTMSMDGGLNDNEHEMLNRIFNTVPVRRRNPPCCRWCV